MRALVLVCLLRAARADATVPQQASWQQRFDLDGDGRVDPIEVAFSGGAHCCYTLSVRLSQSRRRVPIPFELDGGYPHGLDLGRKLHFDVFAQTQPDETVLFMEIATYGGKPTPIPRSWRERYGVRSHFVAIHLHGGRMRVENLLPPPQDLSLPRAISMP